MKLTSRQRQLLAEIRASRSGFTGLPREANDLYALADAGLIEVIPPRGERLRSGQQIFAFPILQETI